MAAQQAPLSLGFSRQEHWSGLPFPSPMHESEKWKWSCSVVSDSSRPHGLQPTRLLCPWDFPGKSTGVGCHCLLQGLTAAAAAKLHQSCLTLCDPIDGSPAGSPVPGILQARTLEWVAISFSNAWKWKWKMKSLSHVWLNSPMNCSLPGSSVHGIFQPRVLEWVAIAFSMKDWLPSPKIKLSEEGKCGFPVWKSREYNPYDGKSSHCGIFRAPYTPSETKLKWWWDKRLQRFKTNSSNSVLVVSTKHQYFNYQKSEDQTQSSGELTGIRGDLAQPYLPVHPWKSSTPTHQAVLSNWVFRNTQLFE